MKTRHVILGVVCGCAVTPLTSAQEQLWATQFGSPADDWIWAAVPGGAGGVVVGGFTNGPLGDIHFGEDDMFLARFNADGDRAWLYQFGTEEDESITRLCADGEGGGFMAGWTNGDLGGAQQGDGDSTLR